MLVSKHGVVRHQRQHDDVLGQDDEHQDEDGQKKSPRRCSPSSDFIQRQTETSDTNISDAGHGTGQQEYDQEGVKNIIQRKDLLRVD